MAETPPDPHLHRWTWQAVVVVVAALTVWIVAVLLDRGLNPWVATGAVVAIVGAVQAAPTMRALRRSVRVELGEPER